MPDTEMLAQAHQLADRATAHVEQYSGLLGAAKGFILANFGPNGLLAACIVAGVLILMILAKIANLTFSALKFLVVPAVVLALVGSFFLPYSFTALLPLTATMCSLGLLFKG